MKILVDCQTLSTLERGRGIGKYLIKTLEALLRMESFHSFTIAVTNESATVDLPPVILEKADIVRLDRDLSAHMPLVVEFSEKDKINIALNVLIREGGFDLYWNPNPLMPNVVLPGKVSGCLFVATVFDLIPLVFEENYLKSWQDAVRADYIKRLTVKLADYDALMAISHSTRTDLINYLALPEEKIHVIHLGVDGEFFVAPSGKEVRDAKKKFGLERKFIMYTGGFDYRKNMERLVSGFSRYLSLYGRDYVDLVIVCSYDDVSYDRFVKLLDKLSVRDRVVLTNFVDERELITLYSLAACFIFPSLYEGFGLPVVEAMAAGLPIASSIFSSIPEVLGDSGLYFDPYDSEDIAEVIGLLMPVSAKPVRIRYERNLARAFTWEKTASNTLDVFESVLNGRDSRLGHCAR